MDEKRFKELFEETERWVHQARRLKYAGDHLTSAVTKSFENFIQDKEGAAKQSPEFLNKAESFRALSDARALLYGLCIENACKAKSIEAGQVQVKEGTAKGLRLDHNVLAMVRQAGSVPTEEEEEFLKLLSYQTRTLSKYPISKNLSGQNDFTGRSVGARPEESAIVERIVVKVLGDDSMASIFKHGYLHDENL